MLLGREVGSVFPCRIVALGKTEMPLDLATQDIFTCTHHRLPDLDGYTANLKGQLSLCSKIQDILPPTVM